MTTKGLWQQAYIVFKDAMVAQSFHEIWGVFFMKHQFKTVPLIYSAEDYARRSRYTAKLTNLPKGTSVYDLSDILNATEAKTCIIPKSISSYVNRPYAYIAFETEQALNHAMTTAYALGKNTLEWVALKAKTCQICGSAQHEKQNCELNKTAQNKKFTRVYNRFKPANFDKLLLTPHHPTNCNPNNARIQNGRSFADVMKGTSTTTRDNDTS